MMSWTSLLLHNTEQSKGKCTEEGSAGMGRIIPNVIVCYLSSFLSCNTDVKPSQPEGQKHVVLKRKRTICEQLRSLLYQ